MRDDGGRKKELNNRNVGSTRRLKYMPNESRTKREERVKKIVDIKCTKKDSK